MDLALDWLYLGIMDSPSTIIQLYFLDLPNCFNEPHARSFDLSLKVNTRESERTIRFSFYSRFHPGQCSKLNSTRYSIPAAWSLVEPIQA